MARILLVDDDKDIRNFGTALLSKAGHETVAVASVVSALEFLLSNQIDLLITDANMPNHTGYDLVRTLRRDPKHRGLVIAMLTGRRERKDIERAVELGVNAYIVKPIDPVLFLNKVSDLLGLERPAVEVAAPALTTDFDRVTQLKLFESAKTLVDVELVSVSEAGLIVRSTNQFEPGSYVELFTDLFQKMGLHEPPLLEVTLSQPTDATDPKQNGKWEAKIAFAFADERLVKKVRAWIQAQTVSRNANRKARAA